MLLRFSLFLELVKELFHHCCLLLLAMLVQALHRNCDLLSSLEPLLASLIQLYEYEMFIYFQYRVEIVWLKLWCNLASEQHSSLLRRITHSEHAFHRIRFIESLPSFFRMECSIQVLTNIMHTYQTKLMFITSENLAYLK